MMRPISLFAELFFIFFENQFIVFLDQLLPPREDIVDMKPENMEDLSEVITAADFHPSQCSIFVSSSSKGILRLCDLRQRAICDDCVTGKSLCSSFFYCSLQLHYCVALKLSVHFLVRQFTYRIKTLRT